MHTETIRYREGDTELEAFVAYDDAVRGQRPAVLVQHAWGGQGDFDRAKCEALAELGYVGIAADNYGVGRRGTTKEENQALMAPIVEDRALLRRRLMAGLELARGLDVADPERLGSIGFCFGGLCVLDLARAGAALRGVVSFHGILAPPGLPNEPIRARVLALHGHDDPMVSREMIDAFTAEMTDAGVDWQLHLYGHAVHAFTNPAANDPGFGTVYEPKADRRSWETMRAFFAEAFE
jgi:dienelactone hydrolase